MGLNIKRNKKGLYQLKSSVSDEILHTEKWITEDEAKKILIERAYVRFLEEAATIDMEFPGTYHVNGKFESFDGERFCGWWLKHGCKYEPLFNKFEEIKEKLSINLELE